MCSIHRTLQKVGDLGKIEAHENLYGAWRQQKRNDADREKRLATACLISSVIRRPY